MKRDPVDILGATKVIIVPGRPAPGSSEDACRFEFLGNSPSVRIGIH
jgi:hypothetical protein